MMCPLGTLKVTLPNMQHRLFLKVTVPGDLGTHVDFVLLMADEEVVHHACFMEIPEADHVFYSLGRGGMHQAHHVHVPSCDPVFLKKARQQF